MRRSTRVIAASLVAAFVAAAPFAQAATKPKPKPKGPVPGSIIKTLAGGYSHGYPRITQNVWTVQKCAGTAVAGQDTNNVSASILPVATYAGKNLTVTFTDLGVAPASIENFGVLFFDKTCTQIDVNDGKPDNGQWFSQQGKTKQVGMIPTGAAFALLQTAVNSSSYQASKEAASWQFVVRVPYKTDIKPTPMVFVGGLPV
jgi:hypothetical protein